MRLTGGAVALVLLVLARIAVAEPSDAERQLATQHYQRGVSLYSEGDYRGALFEFKRAYKAAPTPQVLYNIGQTQFQLQDYAAALASLQKYLASSGPEGKFRGLAEQTLESAKGRVGKLQITASADGAEVTVDDESHGVSPLTAPVTVNMGQRRISASLHGRAVTRTVEVGAGETTSVRLELPIAPALVETPTRRGGRRAGAWVAWSGFGALGVASLTCGVLALKSSSELATKRDTFGVNPADFEGTRSRAKNLALATDILIAATAVTGGVALYLTLTLPKERKRTESARLEVLPGGVRVRGTF